ncbi:substrate-binding periplasmic protein [Chitinibacteraceae bacterium HSL-7]
MRWLLLLLLPCCALADPIRLTAGGDYPPFTAQNSPRGGLATELVETVFAQMGETTELSWLPWARGYSDTLQGHFDATFPYVPTPERESEFYYSQALFSLTLVIFSRTDRPVTASTLAGKRLCQPHGWALARALQPLQDKGHLTMVRPYDRQTCIELILAGKLDYFVADSHDGRAALSAAGVDTARFVSHTLPDSAWTLHLIAPKSNPRSKALITRFNAAFDAFKRSDHYQRLQAGLH